MEQNISCRALKHIERNHSKRHYLVQISQKLASFHAATAGSVKITSVWDPEPYILVQISDVLST
jgi:hypothetical protein